MGHGMFCSIGLLLLFDPATASNEEELISREIVTHFVTP